MTTRVKVRQRDAERVLAAVHKRFGPGATLIKDWDWTGHGAAPYSVVWEEGYYEWAIAFTGDDLTWDEIDAAHEFSVTPKPPPKADIPEAVYIEPITSWSVGIYESAYADPEAG